MNLFSGFRAKFQKRMTSVAFEPILRKQIRKLPKILKSVKIIQEYYSFVSLGTGRPPAREPGGGAEGRAEGRLETPRRRVGAGQGFPRGLRPEAGRRAPIVARVECYVSFQTPS